MKTLNIIIVNQEYESANHKFLWQELSKKLNGETLIMNIPADQLITRFILKKKSRIKESKINKVKINNNLFLARPMFFIRPEILPRFFNKFIAKKFFEIVEQRIGETLSNYKINIITYYGKWIDILNSDKKFNKNFSYYIMDEVHLTAHTNSLNTKSILYDNLGCEMSNQIFTMSSSISEKRNKYADKMLVIGNGSSYPPSDKEKKIRNQKNVGFIGNFRNWIDVELFKNILKSNKHLNFGIAGPIENNMKEILEDMLIENSNLKYHGIISKEKVFKIYEDFDVIIVPYIQNDFMFSTRPIKIVESIFSGTPVVTIPMSGYEESSFIKFAKNIEEFNYYIDFLINSPIDKNEKEYMDFIKENSWESKAEMISNFIEKN